MIFLILEKCKNPSKMLLLFHYTVIFLSVLWINLSNMTALFPPNVMFLLFSV